MLIPLVQWSPLLLLAVLIRLLPDRPKAPRPPDRWDLVAMLGLGVGLSLLCDGWLAAFHTSSGALVGSDIMEYCGSVASQRPGGDPDRFSGQRSRLAALPSVLLSEPGIIEGMARSARWSMAAIGAGIYLWGRALHSRLAGTAGVLLAAASAPLVMLVRTVSFYPEITAVFTLGSALCAAAMRWRRPVDLLLCGVGVGLCFLIDLRGLIWGLAALGPALVVALLAPWRRWPLRLVVLLLPIWLAWIGGRYAYIPNANPLEGQVDLIQRIKDKGGEPDFERSDLPMSEYVWGRTDALRIPNTLHALALQSSLIPDWMEANERSQHEVARSVTPLVAPLAVALLLALLTLRRRPLLAATMLGLLVPYVSSLRSAITLGQLYPRYIGSVAPAAAVIAGVALAGIAGRGRMRLAVGAVGLLVLILGGIDSALSPLASWREVSIGQPRELDQFVSLNEAGEIVFSSPESCYPQ
ncbi:MAG: hypothetical protein P8R54_11680 [Myxococcota bacterium]|nr:hypothetical protein [Myxococcota bacterium]